MKVALVYDVDGWAFHDIARNVAALGSGDGVKFVAINREAWKAADPARFDAVHFFWWHDAMMALRRLEGKRFTVSFHGPVGVLDTNIHDAKLEKVLAVAAAVAAVSDEVADGMAAKFGTTRPVVVHEGIDAVLYRPVAFPVSGFTVGWAGNHLISGRNDYKGVKLIEAAVGSIPGCRLKVAARTEQWRTREQMAEWYGGINLYVCASVAEGNPKPVQEALACGRPFVSTPVGVAPLLIQQSVESQGVACGRLAERTVESLAAGIRWFMDEPGRVALAGAAGRSVVKDRWTWQRTADGYRALVTGECQNIAVARLGSSDVCPPAPGADLATTGSLERLSGACERRRRVVYFPCPDAWKGPNAADRLRAEAFSASGADVRLVWTPKEAAAALGWSDLVVYGTPVNWTATMSEDNRAASTPHLVTLHGYSFPQVTPIGVHGDAMPFIKAVPWLLLTSRYMAEELNWPGRVSWLTNPCPPIRKAGDIMRRVDRPGLCIGTLCSLKGADRVIRWLQQYRHRRVKWAGAASSNLWWDGRAIQQRKPASMDLLGAVNHARVMECLADAPWSMLLSRAESCPMAILESLAAGRPCIVSPVGEGPALVAGSGVAVDADSPPAVERAVVDVLSNLNERSQAAYEAAAQRQPSALAGQYRELIELVLDEWHAIGEHPSPDTVRDLERLSWHRCRFTGVERFMYGQACKVR